MDYDKAIQAALRLLEHARRRDALVVEALAGLDAASRAVPERPEAWYHKGMVLLQMGRAEEALPCMDRLVELDGGAAEAHLGRARCLHALGQAEQAVGSLHEALRHDGQLMPAWSLLAEIASELGQTNEAITTYGKMIELEPDHAAAWLQRGVCRLGAGDASAAVGDLERALEIDPDYAEAYLARAKAALELRDWGRALDDADLAIASGGQRFKESGGPAEAHATRGRACAAMGDWGQAVREYDAAVRGYEAAQRVQPPDAKRDAALAQAYADRAAALVRTAGYRRAWQDLRATQDLGLQPDPKLLDELEMYSGDRRDEWLT